VGEQELFHFDSIGVPSAQEMTRDFGSLERWQELATHRWIERLVVEHSDLAVAVLEGQADLAFIKTALERFEVRYSTVILAHCIHDVRHKRLSEHRAQAELVGPEMDGWAEYLLRQAGQLGIQVLDTSARAVDECVDLLVAEVERLRTLSTRSA
jgi:hypothetical protein